jgi:ABC-type glycerol-3-phosphate transport system permease component
MNSVVVAISTTAISVSLATLSGYAFSRFRLPGGRTLLYGILATQMFPSILLVIPLFVIMRNLHLIDTLKSLVLTYVSFVLPFSVWMLRNFFRTIPRSLDEAAMVDGSTRLGALWRVILPMSLPGIAATAVFSMIVAWDEFLYANTFINSASHRTVSIGLQSLIGEYSTNWGQLTAGAVITTVPIVVFFMLIQRNLTQVLGGGVKG